MLKYQIPSGPLVSFVLSAITFPGSVGECRSESVCITHGFRPGMPAWLPYGI